MGIDSVRIDKSRILCVSIMLKVMAAHQRNLNFRKDLGEDKNS